MLPKWASLQKILHSQKLDALFIENPIDLFYLTEFSLSKGYFLVTEKGVRLFVDGRYFGAVRERASFPVELYEGNVLADFVRGKVGFDSAWTSVDQYARLQKDFPEVKWTATPSPLKEMRAIKTAEEIGTLKRAAALTKQGIAHMESLLKEGVSEEELAWAFESFCRSRGASGMSFEPIVAFGENSAYPHYRAGKTLLQKKDVVLMDVGAIVDHYRGDLTRVVFFGEGNPKIVHFYEVIRRAFQHAVQAIRPGVRIGLLDEIARKEFRKEGLEELYLHSLGHGVGLETHEYPRVRMKGEEADHLLQPGMVITIEPGLYQPGFGGVRYEEMVLVTEQGYEIC